MTLMPWRGDWANTERVLLGELLQAHLSMQAAIDSLPDPVVIFAVGGDLQNVNQAAQTLLGVHFRNGR